MKGERSVLLRPGVLETAFGSDASISGMAVDAGQTLSNVFQTGNGSCAIWPGYENGLQCPDIPLALKVVAAGVGTSPGTPVSDEMNEMAKNTHETTVKMLPMLCTFAADGLMRLPPVRGRRPDTSDMMGETACTASWLAQP